MRVTSLGAIGLENNKALSEDLCELLGEFGIKGTRIYIAFEDVPRENMGYDFATFAGDGEEARRSAPSERDSLLSRNTRPRASASTSVMTTVRYRL